MGHGKDERSPKIMEESTHAFWTEHGSTVEIALYCVQGQVLLGGPFVCILWCIKKLGVFFISLDLEQGICSTFSFFHSAWLRSLCSPLSRM